MNRNAKMRKKIKTDYQRIYFFLVAPKKRVHVNSNDVKIMCFLQLEHPRRKSRPPTIGDRQFVSFVQFYLHKCGEITLDRLWIKESTEADWQPTLSKWFGIYALQLTNVPLPMPGNIKNFKEIALEFVLSKNNFL
jgi:hypothetical protein